MCKQRASSGGEEVVASGVGEEVQKCSLVCQVRKLGFRGL
jgi:hypothetical protein